jgi:predicted nucleotidyltransferase
MIHRLIIKKMNTKEQYISLLSRFASEHGAEYGIIRLGIFGSVAREEHRANSDVDVLIEAPALDLLMLIDIKNRLEEVFGAPVDIVPKTEFMPQRLKKRVEKEVFYV